ncbi:MAG: DMT family protein [Breznakibacter sp.]
MKGFYSILLLIASNIFMTLAWYGHLKFKEMKWFEHVGMIGIVLISWGIALFEYFFQVPANRIGYRGNGGPFSMFELKIIAEAISLTVFTIFTLVFFKNETLRLNHLIGFIFLILAVFFIFKK